MYPCRINFGIGNLKSWPSFSYESFLPCHVGNATGTLFVAKSGITFTKRKKTVIPAVKIQLHLFQLKTGNSGTRGPGLAHAQYCGILILGVSAISAYVANGHKNMLVMVREHRAVHMRRGPQKKNTTAHLSQQKIVCKPWLLCVHQERDNKHGDINKKKVKYPRLVMLMAQNMCLKNFESQFAGIGSW